MKPFSFRLQTKLDITLKEEELLKEEVGEKMSIRNLELAKLETLKNRMSLLAFSQRNLEGKALRADELWQIKEFQAVLSGSIKRQESVLYEAQMALEEAVARLAEKMKERKMLERLREKELYRYFRECLREEQGVIDEIASVRAFYSV